jgi:hypothetical protein
MIRTTPRQLAAELCLWLFVITLSLQMGAGLYELRVVTPLWADAPPASVREWNWDALRSIEPRARFWRYCTAAVGLTALGALISGWMAGGRRRAWLFGSTVMALALIAATYLYFAPALAQLLDARGAGLGDEEIKRRVSVWLWLSRARAAAYIAAWLAALWAFRASAPPPEDSAPRV